MSEDRPKSVRLKLPLLWRSSPSEGRLEGFDTLWNWTNLLSEEEFDVWQPCLRHTGRVASSQHASIHDLGAESSAHQWKGMEHLPGQRVLHEDDPRSIVTLDPSAVSRELGEALGLDTTGSGTEIHEQLFLMGIGKYSPSAGIPHCFLWRRTGGPLTVNYQSPRPVKYYAFNVTLAERRDWEWAGDIEQDFECSPTGGRWRLRRRGDIAPRTISEAAQHAVYGNQWEGPRFYSDEGVAEFLDEPINRGLVVDARQRPLRVRGQDGWTNYDRPSVREMLLAVLEAAQRDPNDGDGWRDSPYFDDLKDHTAAEYASRANNALEKGARPAWILVEGGWIRWRPNRRPYLIVAPAPLD